jgi:hypothetical protein
MPGDAAMNSSIEPRVGDRATLEFMAARRNEHVAYHSVIVDGLVL